MKWLIWRLPILSRVSRPARGAWIEINLHWIDENLEWVAPRTGRVD